MQKMTTMKKWLAVISVMGLGGGMSACTDTSAIDWKAEVQLSDGRIIIVEREAIYVGGGDEWASNRSLGKIDEYRIRFTSMDGTGNTVEWRSTKKDSQTYPEIPLVFEADDSKPTIFTLIGISSACDIYSKYVYQNSAWVEEPLPEQFRRLPTNLLFASKRDLPRLLTLTEKLNRNDVVGHRQALKQIGPNRKVCG